MLMHDKHMWTQVNNSWFHKLTKLEVKLLRKATKYGECFFWKCEYASVMENSSLDVLSLNISKTSALHVFQHLYFSH